MIYDKNNIFAKIIRCEIPSDKIYEDDKILIIKDKYPDTRYKTHLLCLTKGDFIDFNDFVLNSEKSDVADFFVTLRKILEEKSIFEYQLSTNNGKKVGQEIFHFHVHIKSHDEIK